MPVSYRTVARGLKRRAVRLHAYSVRHDRTRMISWTWIAGSTRRRLWLTRRWSVFEEIVQKINGISEVDDTVAVDISGFQGIWSRASFE